MCRERDVFADETAKHLLDVRHDRINTHRAHLKNLLPAEREELAGEGRGSSCSIAYLLNVTPHVFARAGVGQEHRAVTHDYGQQIVEIVGDAAGELTNSLHFLSLPKLVFELSLTS